MSELNKIESYTPTEASAHMEAANRMHQEVYAPGNGTPPNKDGSGNPRQSDHLPSLHLDNSQIEGAVVGATLGGNGAVMAGAGVLAPEAAAVGAVIGTWLARK